MDFMDYRNNPMEFSSVGDGVYTVVIIFTLVKDDGSVVVGDRAAEWCSNWSAVDVVNSEFEYLFKEISNAKWVGETSLQFDVRPFVYEGDNLTEEQSIADIAGILKINSLEDGSYEGYTEYNFWIVPESWSPCAIAKITIDKIVVDEDIGEKIIEIYFGVESDKPDIDYDLVMSSWIAHWSADYVARTFDRVFRRMWYDIHIAQWTGRNRLLIVLIPIISVKKDLSCKDVEDGMNEFRIEEEYSKTKFGNLWFVSV